MNEKPNDGGPAFPTPRVVREDGEVLQWESYGMSLRDYFAAKALQGLMSQDDSRMCPKQEPSEDYLQKWRRWQS